MPYRVREAPPVAVIAADDAASTPDLPPDQTDAHVRGRVDGLTQRAHALRSTDASEALKLAGEACSLARIAAYHAGEARAQLAVATIRARSLDVDQALDDAKLAAQMFDRLGDRAEYARSLSLMGDIQRRRGDCAQAMRLLLTALDVHAETGDHAGEARTRNRLAAVHNVAGELSDALGQYQASLALSETQGDADGVALAVANIGCVLGSLGQFREALTYHTRALAYHATVGDAASIAMAHNNLGFSHAQLCETGAAREHYETGRAVARHAGADETEISIVENLGVLRRDTGDIDGALSLFREVLTVSETHGLSIHSAEASLRLGEILVAAGDASGACEILKRALAYNGAHGSSSREQLAEIHRALSQAHEAAGAIGAALQHFKTFHAIRDDVRGAESERRIRTIIVQAEMRETQREADLLRQRNDALAAADAEKSRLLAALEIQREELERLSREDALTGLRNRRDLDERLALEWERARRFRHPLTVALADVDRFKSINDTYSHATGDAVLRAIGTIVRGHVRQVDMVARYGGEEIAIALVETDLDDGRRVCEVIRAAIDVYDWESVAPGLRVTISIGVVGATGHETPSAALGAADGHLYTAKRNGRNRVVG